MLNILFIMAAVLAGKEIVTEKLEPIAPATQRFDWNKYHADINNHVNCMEVVRRRQKGYYYTNAPLPEKKAPKEIIEGVVDYQRYIYDKIHYGECYTEDCRRLGFYKRIRGI